MRIFALILAIYVLSSCSATKMDTAAEAQAAFEAYVVAINAGDTETAAAMYDDAEGFHWVERGAVQYDGSEKAAASLKAVSEMDGNPRMNLNDIRVAKMDEGSALVSAHFDYAMFDEYEAPIFAFDGWMTVGMVKRGNDWKIVGGQTGPGKSAVEEAP